MVEIEKIILSNLDKKYKYMARDRDGKLFLFTAKPQKQVSNGIWDVSQNSDGESVGFNMFANLFVTILWEDVEPFKITRECINDKDQEREI